MYQYFRRGVATAAPNAGTGANNQLKTAMEAGTIQHRTSSKNQMSRGNFILAALAPFGAALFPGCEDDEKKTEQEQNFSELTVQNRDALNQTLFADAVSGQSLTFTTTGAWTSRIVEANSFVPSWISIFPSSGSEAGNYTVNINVSPNATGAERKATITIICKGESITISVIQSATIATGEAYKPEMTITTNKTDEIVVSLRGTEIATVHWGEGLDETRELNPNNYTRFSQSFTTNEHRTITITGGNITHLICTRQELSSINVSKNAGLKYLDVTGNQLTFLDVNKNAGLIELNVSNNKLATLDFSRLTALVRLDVSGNQLTSLNVSELTALQSLLVGGNLLTSLNVSELTALQNLSVGGNLLTSLNVSELTALQTLYVGGNLLTSLNVSGLTALQTLYVDGNLLTSLNVSGLTALGFLDVSNNHLTSLDVSGCTELREINAHSNSLTTLNVSGLMALEILRASNNQLTLVNVSRCSALSSLGINNNPLTSLDVSGCTALSSLNLSVMSLTSLSINGGDTLKSFVITDGPLIYLDVSGCTALQSLYIRCQLTSLNVSGLTSLGSLDVSNNQLTTLNVSGCTTLRSLNVRMNQFTSTNLNNLFETLHGYTISEFSKGINIGFNPGTDSCDRSIAEAKEWIVSN